MWIMLITVTLFLTLIQGILSPQWEMSFGNMVPWF